MQYWNRALVVLSLSTATLLAPSAVTARQSDQDRSAQVVRLEATPSSVTVIRGETVPLTITAFDAAGNVVEVPIRLAAPRRAIRVADGELTGMVAGEYEMIASVALPAGADREPPMVRITVTIDWPAVTRVELATEDARLYRGTTLPHEAIAYHADGTIRPDANVEWTTDDATVATVDRYGFVHALEPGSVTVAASVEGVSGSLTYSVVQFPGAEIELTGGQDEVRTGDVLHYSATIRDENGQVVDAVPLTWTLAYTPPEDIIAPAAPGQVDRGKVVADVPGVYTVMATAGNLSAQKRFTATPRDVVRSVQVVGHGRQDTHYTSDFWVFEGVDSRDYAITGSRQAQSHGFVWDVTDPANIVKTDSIQVDARSLNDVKVSPDSRYAVITREGASNRRNGLLILDMSTPAHPTIAAIYDEGLTGGVHNVFATNDYLFALSGGDKYVILDVRDINHPKYVSEYDHPNSRIHDLWVHDGIAYSAEWGTGVVMVDVGNGRWGGAIENPTLIGTYPLPSGQTHAVFPYVQESTGKFYLFAGDEITNRRGLAWAGSGPDVRMPYDPETRRGGYPRATSGYVQIIDLTDPEKPQMVARYEVPEFGTHNIWVEDDILYQAYYEGGVRMVDVSGELMGNLYTQGREIAVFKAHDPIGWIANAPAAWSVMPFKGNVFFSDISSGLWSVKLEPKERPVS